MATKTKKKSTKAKAKGKSKAESPIGKSRHDRDALMPQVVELREGGMGWEAISAELEVDPGLCRLLYMTATVKPKDVIKGDEDDIAAGIIEARDELQQSWGLVAARCRLPESKVRGIYKEATGNSDKQGYKVVQERTAAKAEAKGAAKKANPAAKGATAKSKKKAVAANRKGKKGSANPS